MEFLPALCSLLVDNEHILEKLKISNRHIVTAVLVPRFTDQVIFEYPWPLRTHLRLHSLPLVLRHYYWQPWPCFPYQELVQRLLSPLPKGL